MWIVLNDAFLSIVQPYGEDGKAYLLVRARVAGDIERVFPDRRVTSEANRDYAFRAMVPRDVVIAAIGRRLFDVDYPNFKDSVVENDRHDAYFEIWHAMHDFQTYRQTVAAKKLKATAQGKARALRKLMAKKARVLGTGAGSALD